MTMPGVTIAASGLNAADTEMDVISENLANASTPGYISQTAELTALGGGPNAVGSGVEVSGISIDYNAVLSSLMNTTAAASSSASATAGVLTTAQSLFGEPSSTGLQAQLSIFWSDWNAVATSPGNAAAYDSLVGAAEQVTESLNTLASGLETTATGAESQLDNQVSQVNSQLTQLASLNKEAVAANGANSGQNGIAEEQQSLVSEIASEIGGTASTTPTGAITYRVGGINLVEANNAAQLALSGSGGATTLVLSGTTTTVPVDSGTVAGLVAAMSTVSSWQTSLDNVATTLANTVNTQLEAGVSWNPVGSATATSSPGTAMFSYAGTPSAATIEVSPAMVANPTTIAAGTSAGAGPLDGGNAAEIASLSDTPGGADAIYQALVGSVGSAVQAADASQSATATAAAQASSTASSAEGVNQNSQLVAMLNDQQAYEASAKVITTAQSMVQSLLQAVS